MKEKAELYPIESLAQEGGKDHEMVIVNPDEVIVGADDLEDFVGEELVDGDVGLPERSIEAAAEFRGERKHVVEERPEVLLAKAEVEAREEIGREEDGDALEVFD